MPFAILLQLRYSNFDDFITSMAVGRDFGISWWLVVWITVIGQGFCDNGNAKNVTTRPVEAGTGKIGLLASEYGMRALQIQEGTHQFSGSLHRA